MVGDAAETNAPMKKIEMKSPGALAAVRPKA
jgi:hypothetical protein